jgi:hypothetical protein
VYRGWRRPAGQLAGCRRSPNMTHYDFLCVRSIRGGRSRVGALSFRTDGRKAAGLPCPSFGPVCTYSYVIEHSLCRDFPHPRIAQMGCEACPALYPMGSKAAKSKMFVAMVTIAQLLPTGPVQSFISMMALASTVNLLSESPGGFDDRRILCYSAL